MKLRIRPSSTGVKGVDWRRIYILERKIFLFWKKIDTFKTLEEGMKMFRTYNVVSVEWKVY